MGRRLAREWVFKILFAIDVGENTPQDAIEMVITRPVSEEQKNFVYNHVSGIIKNIDTIDEIITKYSLDWNLERLPGTDKNILRIAIFEMIFCDEIPVSVSINEAVEIAKKYSDDDSYKFINGVLGSIAKETPSN
ncbi:MAG TPA: transcription antitermination factor NusB [Thermoanaerobacterales bacterium]|nr:transcription antitermination factor NusB [Thermoanaerobacterales bacterium]